MTDIRVTLGLTNGHTVAYTTDEPAAQWVKDRLSALWTGQEERAALTVTGKPDMHVNLAAVVSATFAEEVSR